MSSNNSRNRAQQNKDAKACKNGKQSSEYKNTQKLTKANSTKNERRAKEVEDTAADMSRGNPVELYTGYPKFAEDAARLPFAMPVGQLFDVNITGNGKFKYAAPGVMRITFTPAIGISKDFTSPINRSSIKFWTYLRSIQKANGPYDHQDITMMEVALDSCIMFHSLMRRAYGLLSDWTPINEYYPQTLILASGFNPSDLKANIADFRMYINQFAYNLQQYALPKNIRLFGRHQWMAEGIYVDSPSTRAQTYIFVPKGFWQYDNTVETGSQLTFSEWISDGTAGTNAKTFAQVVQFGNQLLNAISNEEDFGYISGDLYTFYNGDTFKLEYTEELYKILPAYNETVLSQIENAVVVGNFSSAPKITQNPSVNQGAILFNPTFKAASNSNAPITTGLMNFHWDSPNSDQVLEATRLMSVVDSSSWSATSGTFSLKSCGTEIVNEIDVYTINPATGAKRFNPYVNTTLYINSKATSTINYSTVQDALLTVGFDWAPGQWVVDYNGDPDDNTKWVLVGTTWDVDNCSPIYPEYLANINIACLMSLFMVPEERS